MAALIVGGTIGGLTQLMPENLGELILSVAILTGIAVLIIVATVLSAKRHVKFYRDDTKRELLLQIFQDKKVAIIHATYTVADAAGAVLAKFDKNYLHNIFRKRWYCSNPEGSLMCMAKEDSAILSLLRRLLGPLFGLLRTNFIIVGPDGEQMLGEFNRKFTILDRYALDMKSDPTHSIDRRVAVALCVMLDTGERR
ncbi:MAG: hypothetical protein EXS36_12435 [Pedosphaera sp.]|nr:hypothetical protein [Pedosphaera sp.]